MKCPKSEEFFGIITQLSYLQEENDLRKHDSTQRTLKPLKLTTGPPPYVTKLNFWTLIFCM